MAFTFVPEYKFDVFSMADADFLTSIGVKGIILDIDNTLEPYENSTPGEHVKIWLNSLSEHGIKAAIVSNNSKGRAELFNKDIGLPLYYKAKKPFKKNLIAAMKDMNTTKKNTIFMGDQIFTDVWAAHNAGIPAILVNPIKDKTDLFTKFKRWLEKPIIKKYETRKKN